MMEITREMKMQMFGMKLDGKNYQTIAQQFGCSVQNVVNALHVIKSRNACGLYPGLRAWMYSNHVTQAQLAKMIDVSATAVNRILVGVSLPHKVTIDAILRVTGLTYEEAFGDPRKTD